MEISAKNQIRGKVTSVIHGTSYSQVAVEQTDADGNVIASGVQEAPAGDANEWNSLFGDEVLESKFQDGHYVYTVIAGGGTGDNVYPPTIYVADVESAVDFNNVLMP